MNHLHISSRVNLDTMISRRPGEAKLGERLQTVGSVDEISSSDARFVLLGIPEDIGVRANLGTGGTGSAWIPALKALLNVQSTSGLDGEEILMLGSFDFMELNVVNKVMDVSQMRERTARVDAAVTPVIEQIVAAGKIPVVIGGGHNNAYPLIRGVAQAKGQPVNCINLDAHSDYRALEGRHSGNGFRYARREGFLKKYAVTGLHENYNTTEVIRRMTQDTDIHYTFYEDIFIREKQTFREAVYNAIGHTEDAPCGVELDLDCVEGIPASAMTPCGISSLQARQYVNWCATDADAAWLHIAEGAAVLSDGRTGSLTGKLIAYLVTDFMKAILRK